MGDDMNSFLQVDFKRLKKVTRVATQGRPGGMSYVTQYSLSHSLNGLTWTQHDQVGEQLYEPSIQSSLIDPVSLLEET